VLKRFHNTRSEQRMSSCKSTNKQGRGHTHNLSNHTCTYTCGFAAKPSNTEQSKQNVKCATEPPTTAEKEKKNKPNKENRATALLSQRENEEGR